MNDWETDDRRDDSWDPWPEVQLSPVGSDAPDEHYQRSMSPEGVGGANSPWLSSVRTILEPDLPRRNGVAVTPNKACYFCERPTDDVSQSAVRHSIAMQKGPFEMVRRLPNHPDAEPDGYVSLHSDDVKDGKRRVCLGCFGGNSKWFFDSDDNWSQPTRPSRVARRKYNELEKRGLIDEDGEASNHERLDVTGTHYETDDPADILRAMPFGL